MSWQYFRKGKLRARCDDVPETMEDAVIELQENGIDVSDCIEDDESFYGHYDGKIVNDFWSPDYPPEEDDLMFQPLSDEEMIKYKECIAILKPTNMKVRDDFMTKLNKRIAKECKASLYQRFIAWCKGWTDEEITYLVGWIFILYLMVGVIKYQPSILDVILWPFI